MPIPKLKKRSYGYNNNKKQIDIQNMRQKKQTKRIKNTRTPKRLKSLLFKYIVIAGVLLFFLSTILIAWVGKDLPDPDKLSDRQIAQSTKIYDKSGEHLLYEIFAEERRTLVELDEIPKNLIHGLIATEDSKFYEHNGIRPLSILRSVIVGIFTNKRVGSGASTLTQQLVKNAILNAERSYTRKLKEVLLTIRLEQKYSKDQILKIYFNEIPYGSTNYGVESAAQSYFGKHVSDLNLAESATLAGFPKAPSHYINNPDALKQRRDFVLSRMYEEGFITEAEKNEAQGEELILKQTLHNISAPHFVLYVKEKLVEEFGETLVETGGLKVITTLDWDMQQIAEKALSEDGVATLEEAGADNASLVALDPRSGQILAMVGSRDYWNDEIKGQFNVATQGKRQPGSSFKPIVYAAAFEKGYTADTVLYDTVTNFAVSGKPYAPQNYDLQEHGPMTIRYALQGSLNIPAVKALYLVGPKKGVEFAERLGYTTLSEGNFGLSLVLGGGEVKLLEHVNAYAVFANNGIQHKTTSILKVEDNDGKILKEWKNQRGKEVLSKEVAALMSNILSDDSARAWAFGANSILTLPGRSVATKTGTTSNYVDAWIVGYTPSIVAGVWAGNTDNHPMNRGFGGSRVAGPIWNQFMREVLKNKTVEQFPTPPENDAEKPVLRGSSGGQIILDVDKVTGKLATSSTPQHYIEKRVYIQPHSILHYVQKDDPRGDLPKNPADDPQYEAWESSVKTWIEEKIKKLEEEGNELHISFDDPPTEYDDAHTLELVPTLEILFPQEHSILHDRHIQTDIRVTAPRGVSKVTYKLDGVYVGVVNTHPFNLDYNADAIGPGEHTLTIIVEDDIGNQLEKEVIFNLDTTASKPRLSFLYDYSFLAQKSFPHSFIFEYNSLDNIETITLSYIKNGQKNMIISTDTSHANTFDKTISLEWSSSVEPGDYTLVLDIKTSDGQIYESDKKNITVG